MGRLYYFLSVIAIGILGCGASLSLIPMDAIKQAQTPEAMQAAIDSISMGKVWAINIIFTVLFIAATCLRLANAGMSKLLSLLMFIPLVNFCFMIFLFFKAPQE